MNYTGKDITNAILSGAAIGMIFGAAIFSTTLRNVYHRGQQIGIKQGRTEATSNLVTNINAAINLTESNLFNYAKTTLDDKKLSHEKKEGYLNACSDYVEQLRAIQDIVNSPFAGITPRLTELIPFSDPYMLEKISNENEGDENE